MKINHCASCAWWERTSPTSKVGNCHGAVPKVIPDIKDNEANYTAFPVTQEDDYCKEHQSRDEVK